MPPLPKPEIDTFVTARPDWSLRDDGITKVFEFRDFNQAMGFVVRVALEAEKANHHPDIDIRWNEVTITLSTHSAGGITERDLALAERCDEVS